VAVVQSTGVSESVIESVRSFFLGQAIGLASLIPGGFGSADAFWIAHLPLPSSVAAAALIAYRFVYYIVPWVMASLILLSWASHRAARSTEIARRLMAGLAGAAGILILLSTATPALAHRLALLDDLVPLPVVEISHFAAAATGVLLLALARGLARGYAASCSGVVLLLLLAAVSAILKGLDYEEAVVLGLVALLVASQRPIFDRPSHGDWLEPRDLGVAFVAFLGFIIFGVFAHRVSAHHLASEIATYQYPATHWFALERSRFLRVAGGMLLALSAAAGYVLLRVPVSFRRPGGDTIDRVLAMNADIGSETTPMMVANGDKDVFVDGSRGFCLYRTIGPYLVVFSDPVVCSAAARAAFLDALFRFAGEIDRRPVFYQVSVNWIPPLHDRGYAFFKLGEEARVPLETLALQGHAGKEYRQFLRRAERDKVRFRVMPPYEVVKEMATLAEISADWLQAKRVRERQFSIGFFDPDYLRRFPCGVVEDQSGTILAFANMLQGPKHEELSVDLMRYRSDGPRVMDFLFTSLMLYGKEHGYKWFNMGMAPLSSVGELRGAHARERLANVLFQHGENWYNFQGLRQYKEKFGPEWVPRYMAYQNPWEWPIAIGHVSALIAGGWQRVLLGRD
jgi:phosphatidylglycerol lysyltransferase